MGQVYDIPYSALIATLLLKNRVVIFKDISDFELVVSSWGYDYCVVDDIYMSNLPYCFDDFISMFLVKGNNYISIRNDLDYESRIGYLTVRQFLEKVAEYPGDILLNYIGYEKHQRTDDDFIDKHGHKHGRILTKVKSGFSSLGNKNIKLKNRSLVL